jgi:hypothetical protein
LATFAGGRSGECGILEEGGRSKEEGEMLRGEERGMFNDQYTTYNVK